MARRAVTTGSGRETLGIGVPRGRVRRGSLPGDDGYFALRTLAGALGADPRVITQFEMDDAPLAGRHRLQHHSAVELGGLFGPALRQPPPPAVPARPRC